MSTVVLSSCALQKVSIPENFTGDLTLGQVPAAHAGKDLTLSIRPAGLNQGGVFLPLTAQGQNVVLQLSEQAAIFKNASYRGKFVFSLKEEGTLTDIPFEDNATEYPAIALCFDPCVPGLGAQVMTLPNATSALCSDCDPCA